MCSGGGLGKRRLGMQLSRRRLLGTFTLGAGALVLAACGQSTSTSTSTSSTSTSSASSTAPPAPATTSAPAAAAPPASGASGPLTLSVISWNSGSSAEAFQNAVNQSNDQ